MYVCMYVQGLPQGAAGGLDTVEPGPAGAAGVCVCMYVCMCVCMDVCRSRPLAFIPDPLCQASRKWKSPYHDHLTLITIILHLSRCVVTQERAQDGERAASRRVSRLEVGMCTHTYTHRHIHVYIHTYVHTHIHACAQMTRTHALLSTPFHPCIRIQRQQRNILWPNLLL
jgi:hypothetical protein